MSKMLTDYIYDLTGIDIRSHEQNNMIEEALSDILDDEKDESNPMNSSNDDSDTQDGLDDSDDDTSGNDPDDETDSNDEDNDSDDLDTDDNDDETEDDEDTSKMDDNESPHLELNKRILIARKLSKLHETVKSDINRIVDGPSFANKPVTLLKLNSLAESILLILETINKGEEYDVLILKYSIAVRTYSSIINDF